MIGNRELRVADWKHLTGSARNVADIHTRDLLHAAILRSPVAHGRICRVDVTPATAQADVVAGFDGRALAEVSGQFDARLSHLGAKPMRWSVLAVDKVRFVGEPVAVVVATSRRAAEDALALIDVEIEPLPAVLDAETACHSGSPLLYEEWGTNEFLHMASESDGFEDSFRGAAHVLEGVTDNHRLTGVPLEGHAVLASYDEPDRVLGVWASNQQPHQLRTVIAEILGLLETSVHVIVPDMGGGFGNKQHIIREEVLIPLVSRMLGRPVRWLQDRTENLTASVHARDQRHVYRVAFSSDGVIAALAVEVTVDLGNPVLYFSGAGPGVVAVGTLPGGYGITQYRSSLRCIATNKCPTGAYRGFGQPEAHLTVETVMESIARYLKIDAIEIRKRNVVPDAIRPWETATGAKLDIGPLSKQIAILEEALQYAAWRKRQRKLLASKRYLGVAVSVLVQGTGPTQFGLAGRFGGYELGAVSVLPDGSVRLVVATCSQGQGHETVLRQVAAEGLGDVPLDQISVVQGDTNSLPYGMGTWGSRTAMMAGGAILRAARTVRGQMRAVAASLAGVSEGRISDGELGTFRHGRGSLSFNDVAAAAWLASDTLPLTTKAGLWATIIYDPRIARAVPDSTGKANFDHTYGSHVSGLVLECDVRTGEVEILDVVIVSDCGRVINPGIVEQQHQGGFVQGASGVLREELTYDSQGRLTAVTLSDYQLAILGEFPRVRVVHVETPSGLEGGFRGVGEASTIAAPALIVGAVNDALAPLGVSVGSTNLRPARLRALVTGHGCSPGGGGAVDLDQVARDWYRS